VGKDQAAMGEPWRACSHRFVGSSRHGNQIVLNSAGQSVWMEDLIKRVNDAYGVGQTLKIVQDKDIVADDNRLRDNGIEAVMVARELFAGARCITRERPQGERLHPARAERRRADLLSVASLLV